MPRPRLAGCTAVRSLPSSLIAPREGSRKPAIICSVVVFPQPEGPRKEMNSPFPTARLKSSTTVCGPNCFATRSSSRKDMDASGCCCSGEGRRWDCGVTRSYPRTCPSAPILGSALDLAIPPLGPFLALVVDDRPVRRVELCGALADRSHFAEFRRDHDRLQHRAVAVMLPQHALCFRRQQRPDQCTGERRC